MTELLLGCGSNRQMKLAWQGKSDWTDLVTLDFSQAHNPNVVHDLGVLPLPFPDESFDEIHAYEVMEHVGKQGDWKFFFDQWTDLWRLLKPGGVFVATSPHWASEWAWGDPGHSRIISGASLVFLHQPNYRQVGFTPMTDYRFCYRADFDLVHNHVNEAEQFEYVLQAVKPSRVEA